ncbi:MAG: hypothetical protein ACFFG0_15950 [Candidatus Thorarchaeota archaeon]
MAQTYKKLLEEKSQKTKETENNQLLGDLNPRYFEETYSLKEAKDRARAASLINGSNNSFLGGF